MSGFWRRLLARLPFMAVKPRVVALVVPAFVSAAAVWTVLGVAYFASVDWLAWERGQKAREVVDSLLPLFKWRSDLGQFLVQAALGLVASAIAALVFVLLYNTLLSILGEEED